MRIRTATQDDLDAICRVEAICFPASEAGTRESFAARLKVFPRHFLLLEDEGRLIGFVNGMVTDDRTISDRANRVVGPYVAICATDQLFDRPKQRMQAFACIRFYFLQYHTVPAGRRSRSRCAGHRGGACGGDCTSSRAGRSCWRPGYRWRCCHR